MGSGSEGPGSPPRRSWRPGMQMEDWPSSPSASLPPSTYLLVRRLEFINATLNYAAHLSPQLWGERDVLALKQPRSGNRSPPATLPPDPQLPGGWAGNRQGEEGGGEERRLCPPIPVRSTGAVLGPGPEKQGREKAPTASPKLFLQTFAKGLSLIRSVAD